jgi:DNA-binding NtrC family response regulator
LLLLSARLSLRGPAPTRKGLPRVDRRILIVDDDDGILHLLRTELQQRGYEVVGLTSSEAVLEELTDRDFGVVLIDLEMKRIRGVDLCRAVALLREETPVIVMTAFASVAAAVACIRAGAYDFVTKPFDLDSLVTALERAFQHHDRRQAVKRVRGESSELQPFEEMIGESKAMERVCRLIARVAETDATVLVTGESGTGKELVARALHALSPRAGGQFIAINCAAMQESLLESELFGHVKGAFTDAHERAGLFSRANGGTLFLDDIAEMPMSTQAKFLRALQERKVRQVGSDSEVPFDARIVAASNRDLELEVQQKRFREDLFYRINVMHIEVPPLRLRDNDVLLLARSFLGRAQVSGKARVTGITGAAAERLAGYPWPGNVRELQNCIEGAVALAKTEHLEVDDLPERIVRHRASPLARAFDGAAPLPMDEVERRYIRSSTRPEGTRQSRRACSAWIEGRSTGSSSAGGRAEAALGGPTPRSSQSLIGTRQSFPSTSSTASTSQSHQSVSDGANGRRRRTRSPCAQSPSLASANRALRDA